MPDGVEISSGDASNGVSFSHVQKFISKLGGRTVLGTVIALHTITRSTRLFGWIWGKIVSGNLPIESGRAQGYSFLCKNDI